MKIVDLLNRLKWDDAYDFEKVKIYYEERVNKAAFLTGREIKKIGEKFLETERGYIPLHRIRKIEYKDEILWLTHSS